jgi:hypothetical protein
VDLTLRDGVNLQEAITSAKQIDEQSKAVGFYQEALDHVARQGYGNAKFEVGGEEGLDIVEEFYSEEGQQPSTETESLRQDIVSLQNGLAKSVRVVN